METYAAYGNAVKRTTILATRVAAQRGLGEAIDPLPLDKGLRLISDAQDARGELWEEMLLLGDPETIAAARQWHETSWILDEFARGFRTGEAGWHAAMIAANDARV